MGDRDMTIRATIRAFEAAQKRHQREAKRRQRELERRAREMAKLSAQEQARLEVETHENAVEVLLSVHKEQADPTDWLSISASLPPVRPLRTSHNEIRARQRSAIASATQRVAPSIEDAILQDDRGHQSSLQAHEADHAEWAKLKDLAHRILSGDAESYIVALRELSPFSELASVGSSLKFTVHSSRLVEAILRTNGRQAIPSEIKSLTTSGKLSVRAMPRARFVEIYQDYVCGCVLRVAREIFALLPIDTFLITATAEALDGNTGQTAERPFLSVAIPRATLNTLNFDLLDPSDAIMAMTHRGDLKASRKSGDFEFITPLSIDDLPCHAVPADTPIPALINTARRLRADLVEQLAALNTSSANATPGIGEVS